MGIGTFFRRLVMSPHQAMLHNPDRFDQQVDPKQLVREIEENITDAECRDLMVREAKSFIDDPRPLTIRNMVTETRQLRDELARTHDRAMAEFGQGAICGADLVLYYMINSANQEDKPRSSRHQRTLV